MQELQTQYMQELLLLPVGDLTVPAVHAKLAALEAVKGELQKRLDDMKFITRSL